jgi:enolase
MVKIINIHAIQILDSRGNPTIKTFIELENGVRASASVPSGASTGTHEAFELRDNEDTIYHGKGVTKAIHHVNHEIAERLIGESIISLQELDSKMIELDGTANKSKLGANAILSVSLALMRAYAKIYHIPLWKAINEYYFNSNKPTFPRLFVNIINGGKHASWNFDIQEFIICPHTNKPHESAKIASEIFHTLQSILEQEHYSTLKGDEGGFSPLLDSNEQAFSLINAAIKKSGYSGRVMLGIDAAASEFYHDKKYNLKKEDSILTNKQLVHYYQNLQSQYGVASFEDPFAEDDWEGFGMFMSEKKDALIIGDDLYTTNPKRLAKGIESDSTNAILIKPNQIGTLSETIQTIKMAQDAGFKIIISHRSGETEDSFIADLAVASGSDFLKAGSMSRSERLAKYNRLIEIEEMEM